MLRIVMILWFALAGLGLISAIGISFYTRGSGNPYLDLVIFILPASVFALKCISFGLVYRYILRTRPSAAVAIVGFSHLFLVIAPIVAENLLGVPQNIVAVSPGGVAPGSHYMWHTSARIADLLGWLVFAIAIMVALNTRHHEPPEDVF